MGDRRHPVTAREDRVGPPAMAVLCILLGVASAAAAPVSLRWQLQSAATTTSTAANGRVPAEFILTNTGPRALPGKHWAIYFNCMVDVLIGADFHQVVLERVTGPLYRLRPGAGFADLRPGQSVHIPIAHPEAPTNAALAPEGPYLVFDNAPEQGLPITDYQRGPFPAKYETSPEQIYARNASVLPMDTRGLPPVFPTPLQYERHAGALRWTARPRVVGAPELAAEVSAADAMLRPYFSGATAAAGAPSVRLSVAAIAGLKAPEGYELSIDPTAGVTLIGVSAAGVARGLASLRQLLPVPGPADRGVTLPALTIRDAPRFAYRGLMLDVARNFQPKAAVLRVLDLMARFKLNTLHFHLTDDEGWRIEIPGLPELTAIGSRRGHAQLHDDRLPPAYGSGPEVGNAYGSGYYTRADYVEILKYAAARHIEVVPEIELPGHARAAMVSMAARTRGLAHTAGADANQYRLADPEDKSVYESAQSYTDNVMNPGLPSTYAFIEHVVTEMIALHQAAGVPLHTLHVGGDELPQGAWERSPAAQALMKREHLKSGADLWNYFYGRVGALLAHHGLALAGWEEIGAHTVSIGGQQVLTANPAFSASGFTLYVWRNTDGAEDLADRLANAGYQVVLTPATRLYFDLAPYPSAFELGQNWAGYVDLDTVFDYVPCDDVRVAPDDPRRLPHREALTKAGREHIRGLEGTLFSETVHAPERLDYMLMPRLLALAERAWAADPPWTTQPDRAHASPLRAQAWSAFVSQLGLQVLPRLDAEHAVLYRIPPPGLKRLSGRVLVNEQFPGFTLRYTIDGGEPTAHSPQVIGPITARAVIRVAAFDRNGRGGRASQLDNR
jgi:hexosaminidase